MFLSITYAVNVTATNRYLQYDGLAQKYGVKHACKWSNPAVLKQTNTYTAGTSHLHKFRCMFDRLSLFLSTANEMFDRT